MCDHSDSYRFFSQSNVRGDPEGPDHCQIYSVHQDGTIYIKPDVPFSDRATESLNISGQANDEFCGDDRLTLIQLPDSIAEDGTKLVEVACSDTPTSRKELRAAPVPEDMPRFFLDKLKGICQYCHCKSKILWRNLHRKEHHFDACFRYVDGGEKHTEQRCFVKLYTMRVPFLSDPMLTFSMAHHIRAQGENFVTTNGKPAGNQEHMFAFIAGLSSGDIGWLLEDLILRWQDIAQDHRNATAGITPRLFMAALLSEYGALISERILDAGKTLKDCDNSLKTAMNRLKEKLETTESAGESIGDWNERLFEMNKQLTGTRSIMHYLAESAQVLVNDITPSETYVKARLEEWASTNPKSKKLKKALRRLDTCKEQIRDKDKLVLVRKSMLQYKMDIKSLRQHIDVNVGMLNNLISERTNWIAERDRDIQLCIQTNTERDGFRMKVMAILTAVLLPATFMAIFLTTPMFDWDPDKPVVNKHPTVVYWGFTGPATLVLIVCLAFMAHPKWFCDIIDFVPPLKTFHGGALYRACEDRSQYITARDRKTRTRPDDGVNKQDETTCNEVDDKNVASIKNNGSTCTTRSVCRGTDGPELSGDRMV